MPNASYRMFQFKKKMPYIEALLIYIWAGPIKSGLGATNSTRPAHTILLHVLLFHLFPFWYKFLCFTLQLKLSVTEINCETILVQKNN